MKEPLMPTLKVHCVFCKGVGPGIMVIDATPGTSKGICWECAGDLVDVWLDRG